MPQRRAIITRNRLIEAAAELFAERGYRATRIADIARSAGVAAGAMQFHFPTKADAARAVIAQQHRVMLSAAAAASSADFSSAVEEVIVVSGRIAELIDTNAVVRAGIRLATESAEEFASPDPYFDWTRFARGPLERAIREGGISAGLEPEELAEVMVAVFTGVRAFADATGERGVLPLLARAWAVVFARVGDRECTLETVREVLGRHGIDGGR